MKNQWPVYNPRTGVKICDYTYADSAVVWTAIEDLSLGAQKWKNQTYKARQAKILEVITHLEADQENLAQTMSNEMGKSIEQSRAEVKKCIESSKYLCSLELNFLKPYAVENPTYGQSTVWHEPIGVVLSILPWNFPAWQGFRAFIPTLLAGNTILLKHSEVSPTAGDLMASYFKKANASMLLQHKLFSHDQTETILADDRIGGVSITGSVKAGQILAGLAAKNFKKSVLELGGSDPAVMLADCDLQSSCDSIARSRLQNAGQVCISAKRAIIQRSQKNEILNQFKKSFDEILQNKVQIVGPLAQARFKDDYNKIVGKLKKYSELIYEFDMNSQNTNENTAFVNPCILYFDQNHEILRTTEVFGPCLIVIGSENKEQAIEIANSTVFGLGASVFGNSLNECQDVAGQLQAGQVAINDYVKSDARLPFGGYKMSGLGREVGQEGFLEFTHIKVISIKK